MLFLTQRNDEPQHDAASHEPADDRLPHPLYRITTIPAGDNVGRGTISIDLPIVSKSFATIQFAY